MAIFNYRCPLCRRVSEVRRSRRREFDVLTLLLLLRPYRCRYCMKRFYVLIMVTRSSRPAEIEG